MGLLCYFGHGVKQSYPEAVKWYQKAAGQGSAAAQGSLGDMYAMGQGVKPDAGKALGLWKQAADKGHTIAMANIGLFHAEGIGVPQDKCEAYAWWRRAAAANGGIGQSNLSTMFEQGDHVPQDDFQALVLATLALRNMEPGQKELEARTANRHKALAKKLGAAQVAKAEKGVFEKSSEQLVAALPACVAAAKAAGCRELNRNEEALLAGLVGAEISADEIAKFFRSTPQCVEAWRKSIGK